MRFRVGSACRSADGSPLSGDLIAIDDQPARLGVVLLDVAGSGWHAARDALRARARLADVASRDPIDGVDRLHAVMTGTRGAVGVVAHFDPGGWLEYVAIGDVRLRAWRAGNERGLAVQRGQLGNSLPSGVVAVTHAIDPGDAYVFMTDGIRSSASLEAAGASRSPSPAALAARILERWHRPYDDAACVVVIVDGD